MIDTAAKRKSVAGVPFWVLGPGVTPDAAKPVAWRQQAGWGYSGIPAGEPVFVFAPIVEFNIDFLVTRSQTLDFQVTHMKTHDFGE